MRDVSALPEKGFMITSMVMQVPSPGVDSIRALPLLCVTIACTDAKPSPVPCPRDLVVKKGSKARAATESYGPFHHAPHGAAPLSR